MHCFSFKLSFEGKLPLRRSSTASALRCAPLSGKRAPPPLSAPPPPPPHHACGAGCCCGAVPAALRAAALRAAICG